MTATNKETVELVRARVYCPICSHMVEATARRTEVGRYEAIYVVKGQKCARCSAALDAASILDVLEVLPSPDLKEVQIPARASKVKRRKRIAA